MLKHFIEIYIEYSTRKESKPKSKNKSKNKTMLEEDWENEMNDSSLHGKDIENMIKRRMTQSNKANNKRHTIYESRAKKNAKTFLSGEKIDEAEEDNLIINKNIDLLHENESPQNLDNKLLADCKVTREIPAPENKPLAKNAFSITNEEVDIIKEQDFQKFKSVKNENHSRSNSKKFIN